MKRKMSRSEIVVKGASAILFVFLLCCVAFTAAYFLTRWFYETHPVSRSDFIVQLVNWGLGLVFLILLGFVGSIVTRPKQIIIWNEMMAALRRIAKGDFNVVIDQEGKYRGQMGEFVESINEMTQELRQVERLRQQFISDVSHEIQSPLTSIRGFANTLQREDLSREEQRRYLSIIEKETIRLSRLSDNLMKLTSLESDHVEWEKQRYRLDKQLEHVVLSCEPQWLDKELDIELDTEPCPILANEELLSQIWLNLLHNAIKFTPQGGSIRLSLKKLDGAARVDVSDTGIGIPRDDQQRIFERFYKGDKQRTRTADGNGLGLSIVHKITELHGGTVRVKSTPGEGTVFEVVLPLGDSVQ
ncbi:sensor histidine kinase [Paenibacillus paeoniae]|uniref:histidine kinase n=1 Tax=Paenibacillus paeoniae TaxID=2292705 RepID=A0A371PJD2_9BACL|nr:HAMP domain-containing sensor histidine kinase [Paenibacillus paeoniae]REK75877.1 sensor histidine kinase [Paenibacillus paeoniae]